MIRTTTEIEASKLQGKIKFIITKKNGQTAGFSLIPKEIEVDDYLTKFFKRLPHMLYEKTIKIVVAPSLKSLVIYDPDFIGQSLLKFPIKDLEQAAKLKNILEQNLGKSCVFMTEDRKYLGYRITI